MSEAGFKNRRKNFTMLANAMLRNPAVSLQAKGLIAVMLSFPSDWVYHMTHIQGLSRNARDAHRSALKELIDFGFIVRQQSRDENGRLSATVYEVSDEGWERVSTVDGFSGDGVSGDGKPPTTNTYLKNTDLTKKTTGAQVRGEKAQAPQQHTPDGAAPTGTEQPSPSFTGSVKKQAGELKREQATVSQQVPPAPLPIPAALLALDGFTQTWGEWLAYRRARKLTLAPVTLARQLKKLEGSPDPLAMLDHTMTQGYQGLYEPRGVQQTASTNTPAPKKVTCDLTAGQRVRYPDGTEATVLAVLSRGVATDHPTHPDVPASQLKTLTVIG